MAKSSKDKKETFFPGTRKALLVANVVPRADRQGFRRTKATFVMSLADGKTLGMPEWLSEPLDKVAKVEFGLADANSIVEIDGMKMTFHAMADTEPVLFEALNGHAKNFSLRRSSSGTPSGEVADIELAFEVTYPWDDALWAFLGTVYNRTVYVAFNSLQARMTFGTAKEEKAKDKAAESEAAKGEKLFTSTDTAIAQRQDLTEEEKAAGAVIPPPAPPGETPEEERARFNRETAEATSKAKDYLFEKPGEQKPKPALVGPGRKSHTVN